MCGAVSVEVEGDPQAMVVCHCKDCRAWSASPVNGAALWPRDKMAVTQGQDNIQSYAHSEGHNRSWCTKCGGHVFTDHIPFGLVDVYASVIAVSYIHLRAHETLRYIVCRLLLEKKNKYPTTLYLPRIHLPSRTLNPATRPSSCSRSLLS